jgi:hypothetical protein
MSITQQVRRRLAVGLTGLALTSALVVGIAPVAADNDSPESHGGTETTEPRDVKVGTEAVTGLASDTPLTITEVVVPPTASNNPTAAPATPLVVDLDDHRG